MCKHVDLQRVDNVIGFLETRLEIRVGRNHPAARSPGTLAHRGDSLVLRLHRIIMLTHLERNPLTRKRSLVHQRIEFGAGGLVTEFSRALALGRSIDMRDAVRDLGGQELPGNTTGYAEALGHDGSGIPRALEVNAGLQGIERNTFPGLEPGEDFHPCVREAPTNTHVTHGHHSFGVDDIDARDLAAMENGARRYRQNLLLTFEKPDEVLAEREGGEPCPACGLNVSSDYTALRPGHPFVRFLKQRGLL